MNVGIVAPAGQVSVDRLHLYLTDTGDRVRIDLEAATFVDPTGLVVIASLMERAHVEGVPITFVAPNNTNVANYLARMRANTILDSYGVAHDLPVVTAHNRGTTLCELQRFDEEVGTEVVADRLMDQLGEQEGEGAVQTIYNPLSELGINVVKHSLRPGGFMALQTYPATRAAVFTVGDSGQGLKASLDRHSGQRVLTDRAAVGLAVQKHVTSTGRSNQGRGLATVVRATNGRSGVIMIASGSAIGTFQGGNLTPSSLTTLPVPLPGTLVYGRLTMDGARR